MFCTSCHADIFVPIVNVHVVVLYAVCSLLLLPTEASAGGSGQQAAAAGHAGSTHSKGVTSKHTAKGSSNGPSSQNSNAASRATTSQGPIDTGIDMNSKLQAFRAGAYATSTIKQQWATASASFDAFLCEVTCSVCCCLHVYATLLTVLRPLSAASLLIACCVLLVLCRLWSGLEQLLCLQPVCWQGSSCAGTSLLASHLHSHVLCCSFSAGRGYNRRLCSRRAALPGLESFG